MWLDRIGLKDFAVLSTASARHRSSSARPNGSWAGAARVQPSREGQQAQAAGEAQGCAGAAKDGEPAEGFSAQVDHRLVVKYEGICIEDLSIKGLARTKLAKSVTDASFGEFRRQLEYKTVWNRRQLAVIDRWYPSSKTCHVCGAVNAALTLADRNWTCVCGAQLDRDLNAPMNIRTEGLKLMAAGHADS